MPHPGEAPVLTDYLRARAADLLRALRDHSEASGSADRAPEEAEAVRRLDRAARRINATLETFHPLLDPDWADRLRPELGWLAGVMVREHVLASRLERLLTALHRLASDPGPAPADTAGLVRGALPGGAARAAALLERQLTLARTRAHSAALRSLGSSRFHAVADAVAVLASEVPLADPGEPARFRTGPLAEATGAALREAVAELSPPAPHPYRAEGLAHVLVAETAEDLSWRRVRLRLARHRYALEVTPAPPALPQGTLVSAGEVLERHRDAAEAAAAAAEAARTPRIAPATAYALGVLHADQRHQVEATRFAFGQLWNATPESAHPESGGRESGG
ncbi:CHAD domain-containing protein [Streptomyces sp. NPDC005438]|uniref:CHAD domain-containing protein n=1 Tax=Streptomyces sp. NPDC005438 TaxID=3156880 RepID=UPI0033A37EFF